MKIGNSYPLSGENRTTLYMRALSVDPCDPDDRPFTQAELFTALSELSDFIAEQGVFEVISSSTHQE